MNPRRAAFRIGGLAAIAGLLVLGSFREKDARASQRPHAADSRAPADMARKTNAPLPITPSNAAVEPTNEPPTAALTILIATRLREWESEDEPTSRPERLHELERLLASDGRSIAGQLKIIEALPANLLDFAFGLPSFQQWMFAHPKAAADWMGDHPGISEARVLTLFQDWGQKSREELRLYLAGLPEGNWKQKAMTAASYEAMPGNPVEAIVWARQMNAGGARNGLLEIATAEWARRDATAAGRWVGQVGDPVLREQLIGSLMIGYAETDPELAAAWGIILLPPGKILDRSAAEVAGVWARQDPAAAGTWITHFPEGEARHMALGNLLNIWTNRDRSAALAWVNGLPDQTLRAQAVELVDSALAESTSR